MEYTGSKIKKTTQINPANPEQFKKYLQRFVGKDINVIERKLDKLELMLSHQKTVEFSRNLYHRWIYYFYSKNPNLIYGFVVKNNIITEIIDTY